jgi:hypothetical protein
MALSETVKALIVKARIMRFDNWQDSYSPDAIALFQTADDNRLYLTDAELAIVGVSPAAIDQVKRLRDQASEIVDEARAGVLAAFPGIVAEGGDLWPPERAEACWRDFWQFLRCVTYGMASGRRHYTSEPGLAAMGELYQELRVPLAAMVLGVKELKAASLARLADGDEVGVYFDHLIEQLGRFG